MKDVLTQTLTLRADARPPHPPAAWLIPGDDPLAWLDEVGRWGVAFDDVRVCPLPRSAADRRPFAVLALLPGGRRPDVAPSPIVQAYGLVAGRLYLPADARLFPPVTDAELARALPWAVQVFHPSVGLIGFAEHDAVRASDLLATPSRHDADWDRAAPGIAANARILAVLPAAQPSVRELIEQSRGDIGSEATDPDGPAPAPAPVRDAGARAAAGLFGMVNWIARHMPRLPGSSGAAGSAGSGDERPGLLRRFEEWSARTAAAFRDSLADARKREMDRLLRMLADQSDDALRYAIPLRDAPTRGTAPPGARLVPRNPYYDANALGRALPGDSWETDHAVQEKLRAEYRKAANRELALGRYRRAAYVFAELLGDFGAAANALRQGRFYRDAAALYRDRLNDAAAAAQCLEAGGLIVEAIPLYASLANHEKVGDLYALLERPDEAARAWRTAVAAASARGAPLEAARLLETKLGAPDEAVAVLDAAWPTQARPGPCLTELFHVLGRHGKHEQAEQRVRAFRDEAVDGALAPTLADVMSHAATEYPNPDVRGVAADATRVIAGNRLRDRGAGASAAPGPAEVQALVNHVTRLARQDRLLARDAGRFVDARAKAAAVRRPPPVAPPRSPRGANTATVTNTFHLGRRAAWKAVLSAGDRFYAIGTREDAVVFVRGRWDGETESTERPDPLAGGTAYRLAHGDVRRGEVFAVPLHRVGAPAPRDFGAGGGFPPSYLVSPPEQSAGPIHDLCVDDAGVLWMLRSTPDDPQMTLCTYHTASRRLLSSHALNAEPPVPDGDDAPSGAVRLVVRDGAAFVLHGGRVLFVGDRYGSREVWLGRPATSLAAPNPHVLTRLAATFHEGGCVHWPDSRLTVPFGAQLFDPVACFTRDGSLVAVGRGRGHVYGTENRQVVHRATFEHSPEPPVAVVATSHPNDFAVFFPDGLVRVMKLPHA